MDTALPSLPRKGRGAVSNPTGRYETARRYATDDGWGLADAPLPRLATTVTKDASRSVIARNQSPDLPFEQSINPYRGCEHGCVYCFARPTHAWLGLSPGLDFESRLFMKPDAAAVLERELRAPKYVCKSIAMGTNTDPYQPLERRERITRQILEVLSAFNHPVSIVTKSALVTRDIDILSDMAARDLASVYVSVTTLDRTLARRMEPRAATPERRLETLAALAAAGIPTGVMAAPMIPALNDMELERILARAADAGVQAAGYILLRLPLEIKTLFGEWLETHYPDRAARVMRIVRETRGGRLYDARFGQRMSGTGVFAQMIAQRFDLACKRHGLNAGKWALDSSRFAPPLATRNQLALF